MGELKIDHVETNDQIELVLKGQIDEDSRFGDIDTSKFTTIVVDFNGVESINSCGIREWINWTRSWDSSVKVVYRNCQKSIVDQVNMVSGFLPENGRIESFYVPYYCEDSGLEKMILFKEGKEFTGQEISAPSLMKDEESGNELEIDVIEAKYFKFLQKAG